MIHFVILFIISYANAGIFDLPSAPKPQTINEKKEATRARLVAMNNQNIQTMKSTLTFLYKELWFNQYGLTPQQVLDIFGTDAGSLIQMYTVLGASLNQISPGGLETSNPHHIVINPDGTAIITD